MHRKSTQAQYLDTGLVIIDADGIPVRISGKADSQEIDQRVPEDLALAKVSGVGQQIMVGATMIHGDTGWRDITSLISGIVTGKVFIRREMNTTYIRLDYVTIDAAEPPSINLPAGWFPPGTAAFPVFDGSAERSGRLNHRSGSLTFNLTGTGVGVIVAPFTSVVAWPVVQIGSPI